MPVSLLRKVRVFTQVRIRRVLGSLARRCPAKLAEHVSDGPRRTLPTRSTFRWMPLHPSRNTIEGTLMEGGSKWARFCGTVRATTDEIGTSVRSERKRHHERKDAHEADDHDHGHRRRRDAGAWRA